MISLAILIVLALLLLKFGATMLRWLVKLGMTFVFVVGLLYILKVWF